MQRLAAITNNIILFVLFLLLFLLAFESRIQLPAWLQVVGRLHPVVLHIPIGSFVFSFVLLFLRDVFRKKQFRLLVLLCLLFVSLSASVTALFGFFLSVNGDYGTDALLQHKVSGVVFSIVSYALLLWFRYGINDSRIFYGIGIIVFLFLILAGHTGAILTHGENYILEPVTKSTVIKDPEATPLYELVVMPVLEGKCFGCHNESKAKGKLIMTSVEKFRQGGKSGPVWMAGDPDSSRMIKYIHLPLEHDDHMPPDGKPQLSSFEIALLESWIRSGADFDRRVAEYPPSDTLVALAKIVLNTPGKRSGEMAYTFKAASADAIEKLNTPFRFVAPLYQSSPALQADFFIRESYQPKALEELRAVSNQVVSLNLSKMPVTDDELRIVSGFKNLEKLNLNFTAIQGHGLKDLATLSRLESISLSGTGVTAEHLHPLASCDSLKEVFLWNTQVREEEIKELKAKYPDILFVRSLFADERLLPLGKPQWVNEGVLKKGEPLILRHSMPGVSVRYTLDNTAPDSLSGLTYNGPVKVKETVKLKAIACKEGWYCSKLLEATVFVEGIKPDQVNLLSPPDKQYQGEGASSLTDLQKGLPDFFREPSWLGFRENAFEASFEFSNSPKLSKVVISYADNLGSYIFPPAEVEVWGGSNENDAKLIKSVKLAMPQSYRANSMEALVIPFGPATHAYYKIVAKPVGRLPEWHGGKGQKGWVFVDEVFYY